ncbi:uncharacterized protein C14orf28 homolog [Ptychodera flava]|uniref:uncharacterized protein C14orf28 homolog n=1 Tax=Ptychodera flava TaxID=63121 RepID=UPI00396A14B3
MDLYLKDKMNMISKEIKKKGFTKDMKAAVITPHHKNLKPAAVQETIAKPEADEPSATVVLKSNSQQCYSQVSFQYDIPPWGGQLYSEDKDVKLMNTCPIDNCLTIFYILQHQWVINIWMLPLDQAVKDALASVIAYFSNGQYAEGKWAWMSENIDFPERFLEKDGTVNLYGNEGDLFVNRLKPLLSITLQSVCNSTNCPKKISRNVFSTIVLSEPSTSDNFLEMAERLGSSKPVLMQCSFQRNSS